MGRLRTMRMDEADDERPGPGWYESNRELERVLQVRDVDAGNCLLAEWLAESQRPLPPAAQA
jgi:hypothetical protein